MAGLVARTKAEALAARGWLPVWAPLASANTLVTSCRRLAAELSAAREKAMGVPGAEMRMILSLEKVKSVM